MISYCEFPSIDLCATGSNIKRIADEKGISVRDIQGYFNFEYPNAIYKWYKGQSLPTVDNLLALAKLFGVHMEDILVERDRDAHFLSAQEAA